MPRRILHKLAVGMLCVGLVVDCPSGILALTCMLTIVMVLAVRNCGSSVVRLDSQCDVCARLVQACQWCVDWGWLHARCRFAHILTNDVWPHS